MSKRRSGTVTIDVEVSEFIDEIDDALLLQEIEDRKLDSLSTFDPVDDLVEIRCELLRDRPAEALAIVERLLRPKWSNARMCEISFKAFLAENRAKTAQ